ncbi:hypothetical protein BB560_001454 [Smittium megazygosporum]|uniref:Exportin-1 C-terminal domain-containing protein n=1 Tax=Smittium megazygosporum TaxID=133381 RepID=A0A2T9ZHJ3_9FUNG|nr:hypothetical protein BB560_001454 [Smittium megazygosporum]
MNLEYFVKALELNKKPGFSDSSLRNRIFEILNQLLKSRDSVFIQLKERQNEFFELVYLLISYSEVNELWWWTNEEISKVAQECLMYASQAYCNENNEKQGYFLETVFERVYNSKITSSFSDSSRVIVNDKIKYKTSQDLYTDNPSWKTANLNSVSSAVWFLKNLNSRFLDSVYLEFVPTVSTLLEDYEIKFKLVGLEMTRVICNRVELGKIKSNGVQNLFLNIVEKLLVVRREKGGQLLLTESVNTYITMILKFYEKSSSEYIEKLYTLFFTAIIQNFMYAGDEFSFQIAIFENINPIVEHLGVHTVRYLSTLVKEFQMVLEMDIYGTEVVVELMISVSKSFIKIIDACWPRIHVYIEPILGSLVLCYISISKPENKSIKQMPDLKKLLYQIYTSTTMVDKEKSSEFINLMTKEYPQLAKDLKIISV